MSQIYIKKHYLCTDILYPKHSLQSRFSREIVTAFSFDCSTWNNIKNNDNTLIISILFICLSFDWRKKTSSALEFWRNVYVCGGVP